MADIKTRNVEDLKKEVADKREELRVIRFNESGSRARNVRSERNLRREVARLLTELTSRDLPVKTSIASRPKTK